MTTTRVEKVNLVVVLVDAELIGPAGDVVIRKLAAFYPNLPAMLVCVVDNGFVAHAHFQTPRLLAMLQLEKLNFLPIDLNNPPEAELPF